MKWTADDYKNGHKRRTLQNWEPPAFVYPADVIETAALRKLRDAFAPLPPYLRKSDRKTGMEYEAIENKSLVSIETPIPKGFVAFLENTAEQCTSPQTKHSEGGMNRATHWVQRIDTPGNIFRRLTDGYGISLMFGERFHQFIRNGNNWRGVSGVLLDIDVFSEPEYPDRPTPVYSLEALLDRYPILERMCDFIIPSASSLYEGRPYKARGVVLPDTPITDQRVYRAFGDKLIAEIDCIPANVTKNPLSVGFGNTHNAHLAWRNPAPDKEWIAQAITACEQEVLSAASERLKEKKASESKQKAYQERKQSMLPSAKGHNTGENISTFIENCDPVAEMIKEGLLTPTGGNNYRWHESQHDRSCDILDDTIHIFSYTMSQASPAQETAPVGTYRFYLYHLTGLDITCKDDRPAIRQFLFEKGYGSDPSLYAQNGKRSKLTNAPTGKTSPKNEGSLDRNRAEREGATDTYFESENDDSLHIMLVKDSTGSGKSHTMLAKSKAHGKRPIMNAPHNELAAQAIEMAFEHGYTNPFHFLGREHNWDQSGIANIPVKMRTEELFAKNNCIMVDEVEKYTRKRLAPRTYCEHKCGFKSECAHMAQYKGLGERDFIASCTPGLLFDLNMRGYLELLMKAKPELTDEDLAMDAMLGTESEDWKAFDFAILDDYTVSGLYTDISFIASEFKELAKVWKGTPTGTFAKVMLKAFGKKKPQKIIKAIRKAFEETAEHHAEIAESLTKHIRIGTVKELPRPKGSKESKRLLAEKEIVYNDGGRHFVPVDKDAYTELKAKGLPSVNPDLLMLKDTSVPVHIPVAPVTALMSGVQVKDLTPLWQKGATPIDLIRILLGSIGNDKNAPISRSFRTGETPIAVLTFSIPPQAPVGVIQQIALLSATSHQDGSKNAFEGQSVRFSVHDGKEIDFAKGVQVFQYQDARLTSGSVFEYPTDANDKRLLQENAIDLTSKASERITKLNDWAKREDGLTAFISYKEFTEQFKDSVDGFDIVTHFDKVSGLNFKGLKFLVVFGYPKVKHEVVMEQARRQFGADAYPLPKGEYEELTETKEWGTNGLTIYESQYLDSRLELIRHQLSTEKLEQAIGRARLPAWTDTTTVIFTNAPVSGITQRATLFTEQAFNGADSPSAITDSMQQIADAEQNGDVQAVMDAKGVGKSQAYKDTESTRKKSKEDRDARILELHDTGISQRAIEIAMKDEGYEKASRKVISQVVQNSTRL